MSANFLLDASASRSRTGQAFLAVPTDVVGIPEPDPVTNFDIGDITPDLTDNTDTLMAKDLTRLQKVLIGAAETRVGGLNVDLVMLQRASRLVCHDLPLLRATEDFERHAHGVGYDSEMARS